MHHRPTAQSSDSAASFDARRLQPSRRQRRLRQGMHLVSSLILGMMISWAGAGLAQTEPTAPAAPAAPAAEPAASTPSDAPAELLQTLSQIDAAASAGNLEAVMAFYSPQFTHSDGLTYASLQESLKTLWQQYPGLSYKTQLTSWERDGEAIVAETTTTITGQRANDGRPIALSATITSRQRFEGQKIVQQEVLSERSQLTSGANPPTLQINLPEQVTSGESYEFDAIVLEPLGNRLLLGAALDEPIQASGYLSPAPISLELLPAGGLFKTGRAPITAERRWISAVIIRDDGITTLTQRLNVQPKGDSSSSR